MAKKTKWDKTHDAHIKKIGQKIYELFDKATIESANIATLIKNYNPNKPFYVKDYPQTAMKIDQVMKHLHDSVSTVIANGARMEWDLANEKNDELVNRLLGPYGDNVPEEVLKRYLKNNVEAREAFIQRKTEVRGEVEGLNLSDKVWRYTDQFKEEIELGLDIGLGEGKSADQLSRDLRQYLREPNKLFRRVRDKHGVLRLSKAAKAYHPSRGVYRSSYKNARRLAATETNIAYRTSDHMRWNQLDFVVGIRINLSKNHTLNGQPFTDICDDLQGLYPKGFKFTGWHPLCRCYATSVLKTEDELFRDLDGVDRGSKNAVTKMPSAFTDYVDKHREQIEGWKSKPYWVLDNYKDGDFSKGLSVFGRNEFAKKGKQKFKTEEQKEAIRKEWKERVKKHQNITKMANNVLKVASEYPEVNSDVLKALIEQKNVKYMNIEARKVAKDIVAVKQEEKHLEQLIPNVHNWKKQFSTNELKAAYNAVENTLSKIQPLSLSEQAKALNKEILYVSDGTYLKPHKIYPTWEVAQSAYYKQLTAVNHKIAVEAVTTELKPIKQWLGAHPKIKKLSGLVNDVESLISKNASVSDIQAKMSAVTTEYNAKLKAAQKKAVKLPKTSITSGSQFDESNFTKARKDAAVWDTKEAAHKAGRAHGKLADDTLFDSASASWKDAIAREKAAKSLINQYESGVISKAEFDAQLKAQDLKVYSYEQGGRRVYMTQREASYDYTMHYCDVNEPLQGRRYYNEQKPDKFYAKTNALTDMIDTFETPTDMWFQRGDSGLTAIFSRLQFNGVDVPKDIISKASWGGFSDDLVNSLQSLVGTTMQEGGFMSTACAKNKGFNEDWGKNVILNIYAPKGTKAMYAEHFSHFGSGVRSASWDGSRAARSASQEFEAIFQRGTKMRITKITKGRFDGKDILYFDVEVVAQEVKDISYVLKSNIGY